MSGGCEVCDRDAIDWAYGELAAGEAAAFEEHLSKNPEHRRDLEELATTLTLSRRRDALEPSPEVLASLKLDARVAIAEQRASRREATRRTGGETPGLRSRGRAGWLGRRLTLPVWSAAAAALLLVLSGVWLAREPKVPLAARTTAPGESGFRAEAKDEAEAGSVDIGAKLRDAAAPRRQAPEADANATHVDDSPARRAEAARVGLAPPSAPAVAQAGRPLAEAEPSVGQVDDSATAAGRAGVLPQAPAAEAKPGQEANQPGRVVPPAAEALRQSASGVASAGDGGGLLSTEAILARLAADDVQGALDALTTPTARTDTRRERAAAPLAKSARELPAAVASADAVAAPVAELARAAADHPDAAVREASLELLLRLGRASEVKTARAANAAAVGLALALDRPADARAAAERLPAASPERARAERAITEANREP